MKRFLKGLSIAVALGIAAPVLAGDVDDTMTEKKAQMRKSARDVKADLKGGKTAKDHWEDAKDTAKEGTAKTKKAARKAGRKVKHTAKKATD